MIGTVLCYVLLPAARLLRALRGNPAPGGQRRGPGEPAAGGRRGGVRVPLASPRPGLGSAAEGASAAGARVVPAAPRVPRPGQQGRRADAFFTCRKNVFLAKSTSTQIEGVFAATRGRDNANGALSPAHSGYEILWRDWEDLSVRPCVLEQVSKNTPLFEFRVMSYNILAQDLVEQGLDLYVHCHPDILNWNYRLPNLLQEIQHWDPDVLCLQEVQENHYWEQLEPTFKEMGFACFYKRRTGTKTDGCAVCYKHSRFQLISLSPVEYFRPGLDVLNRDNVGLVLLLQPLLPEGLGLKAVSPLCVANTHVLFNPRRGDIKLAQMALLLAEIDKIAKTTEGSYCPVILCGDLNSVPDSPLYKFIRNGELSYHGMPAWKVSGQEDFSQQLYSRKLLAPLWPSSLGVTDNCQYVALCQPKKLGRHKYSRDFLLQFRFCDVACERPPQLVLLEGVTDAKPDRPAHWPKPAAMVKDTDPQPFIPRSSGIIQHGLNLTSVYSHFLPQRGRPEVTTMPMGLGATVDYIFYSAEPLANGNRGGRRLYQDGALKLLGRLSLLSEDVLLMANGLPNPFCLSDHLCLLASFGLEISSLREG
ncbi:protein angel homolog 1 [Leptosomus discolor]